ncbi:MAG: TIGR03915 family putative DNA repair protein [Clostridiales bacterium]|nr:TIGR03915 family putative DNA repair protein [Clostridiales bacterium]
MVDYLYDGTFEGFLSCIYAHYYEEKASGVFQAEHYQASLLGEPRTIPTDEDKALKVYDAIEHKISAYDMERIYRVFLSSVQGKETALLKYIVLGFEQGSKIRLLHGHPVVYDVQQMEKKVNREVERLSGLIRFSVLVGGVLYSPIEPDHDVCELLAGHFCDRFKNDPFIIHDKRRSKAVIAIGGGFYMSDFTDSELPDLSADEKEYRNLWKKYFNTIAIKERTNPRCQKNFMPARYWKNLTEMR